MRYVIGFILGVMFATSVYENDAAQRAPRTPTRTAPLLRRIQA